jgi:hypothetical protein
MDVQLNTIDGITVTVCYEGKLAASLEIDEKVTFDAIAHILTGDGVITIYIQSEVIGSLYKRIVAVIGCSEIIKGDVTKCVSAVKVESAANACVADIDYTTLISIFLKFFIPNPVTIDFVISVFVRLHLLIDTRVSSIDIWCGIAWG